MSPCSLVASIVRKGTQMSLQREASHMATDLTSWVWVCQNELAILEFIHCMVETLDRFFGNVCELDLMFNLEMVCFPDSAVLVQYLVACCPCGYSTVRLKQICACSLMCYCSVSISMIDDLG